MDYLNGSTDALLAPVQAVEEEGLGTDGTAPAANRGIFQSTDLDEAHRVIDQLRQEIVRRADNNYSLQILRLQAREPSPDRPSAKNITKCLANTLIRQMRRVMGKPASQQRFLTKEIAANHGYSQKQLPQTPSTGESMNAWKNINYFQCMYPMGCSGGNRFCGAINIAWVRVPKKQYIQRREKCSLCQHKTYPYLRLDINDEVAAMLELEQPRWLTTSPKLHDPDEEE